MIDNDHLYNNILLNQEDSTIEEQIAASLAWAIQEFDEQRDKERRKDPRYQALLKLTSDKTTSDTSSTEDGGQHD